MCLAKAYLTKGEKEELLMEDVALLKTDGKTLKLKTLFGEQRELEALVQTVDFQNGRIILKNVAG